MYTRIKAVRKFFRLSQREFGEKLGVSRDVIGNIECGRVPPKAPFIHLVSQQYGINRRWLETGEGEMFQPVQVEDKFAQALSIFKSLRPEFQDYALDQIRKLAELQENQ